MRWVSRHRELTEETDHRCSIVKASLHVSLARGIDRQPDNGSGSHRTKRAPKKEDPHRVGPLGAMQKGENRYIEYLTAK